MPLNFFAHVWTLVLHQLWHKLNQAKHANGRSTQKITKRRLWRRNWDQNSLSSSILEKKSKTLTKISGRNTPCFTLSPSCGYKVFLAIISTAKTWNVKSTRSYTWSQRSLMSTNTSITCLDIAFLILCRGFKFCLPQKVSPIEIHASFEKAYWIVKPLLEDADEKEIQIQIKCNFSLKETWQHRYH